MSLKNIYGKAICKKNCSFQYLKALLNTFVLEDLLVKLRAPSIQRTEDELNCKDYSKILMKVSVKFDISFLKFLVYLF